MSGRQRVLSEAWKAGTILAPPVLAATFVFSMGQLLNAHHLIKRDWYALFP